MMTTNFKFLIAISVVPALVACQDIAPIATPPSASALPSITSGTNSALQEEIARSSISANNSVVLSLQKARILAAMLTGDLSSIGEINTQAYGRVQTEVLPLLVSAGQSIQTSSFSPSVFAALKTEFNEIYMGLLTEMLRSVNNNIDYYQGFYAQTRMSTVMAGVELGSATALENAREEIKQLTSLFDATEVLEAYVARVSTFTRVIIASESTATLMAVRNQQNTLISNAIDFANSSTASAELAKQLYFSVVRTLSAFSVLPELSHLAEALFGAENVASTRTEMTPETPSPSDMTLVIRETNSTYRVIQSTAAGKITQRIQSDSRGLSASDYLFQTVVVRAAR